MRGAFHPQFEYDKQQLLGNPDDGSLGLVSWLTANGTTDFAVVDTLEKVSNETIVDLSRRETVRITELRTSKRAGAAGGFVVPSFDPQFNPSYCTGCTEGNRIFYRLPGAKATNIGVRYINPKTDVVQQYGSVYADPYLYRADKRKKLQTMKDFESERIKTIAEMRSRLRGFAAVEITNLTKGAPIWESFIASIGIAESTQLAWKALDPRLSFFDIVLLEWACSTGEMRNHQALAAHVDGNKSHFMEAYTVWGKVPTNEEKRGNTTIVAEMMPAKLGLPHLGLALVSRCGRDAWHLQLKNTIHAADPSRDQYNWSWVHGP